MIEHLDVTDVMRRTVNHGLMVQWINYDLLERCHHDVRTSVVLYDEHQMFMSALPADTDMGNPTLLEALGNAHVHYHSKGIV